MVCIGRRCKKMEEKTNGKNREEKQRQFHKFHLWMVSLPFNSRKQTSINNCVLFGKLEMVHVQCSPSVAFLHSFILFFCECALFAIWLIQGRRLRVMTVVCYSALQLFTQKKLQLMEWKKNEWEKMCKWFQWFSFYFRNKFVGRIRHRNENEIVRKKKKIEGTVHFFLLFRRGNKMLKCEEMK